MRRTLGSAIAALAIALLAAYAVAVADEPLRTLPLSELRSGSTFLSAQTRAQQEDLTLNPGMLWVDGGRALWAKSDDGAKSCASCHGEPESLRGVAAHYPKFDAQMGRVVNLSLRIDQCRQVHAGAPAFGQGSRELLSLTALVGFVSRGTPVHVSIAGPAAPAFESGQRLFSQRQGQLNLSCANCHEENWGRHMRAEPISQGHPTGFPGYRLEWQTLGPLERRLKACYLGIHAEPPAPDSDAMMSLELYLAWRAEGLPLEAPSIRR